MLITNKSLSGIKVSFIIKLVNILMDYNKFCHVSNEIGCLSKSVHQYNLKTWKI